MEEDDDEVEVETIESLKEKIQLLQDFILESNDVPTTPRQATSHSRELEQKIKYLTDQLISQRQRHHKEELKARVTLQQKVLEAKASSDKEITDCKAQIVVLQARVYALQEELNDMRCATGQAPIIQDIEDDIIIPVDSTRTLLDDSDSEIDNFMNNSSASTASLSFRLPVSAKITKPLISTHVDKSKIGVDLPNTTQDVIDLEKQIAELKYNNNRLSQQKTMLETQLEQVMSDMSELGSTRHSNHPEVGHSFRSNSVQFVSSPMRQEGDALFVGLVQRKQSSGLLGRYLPRLLIIDRHNMDFWKYPKDIEKSLDEIKLMVSGLAPAERSRALVRQNCVFRRAIPCYSLSHADAVASFGVDIRYKSSITLHIKATSSEQQSQILDAIGSITSSRSNLTY